MNAGYVYVLAFDNGTVKVGQTQNASQRLNSHKSSARGFGLTVTDEWVSPLHADWRANEDELKVIAANLGGTPTSQEYFKGVDFAAVVEKAQELTFTTPEPDADPEPRPAAPAVWDERFPKRTAREHAIRDAAAEWVTEQRAHEVVVARMFLDLEVPLSEVYAIGEEDTRMGDLMKWIHEREHEIGKHFDTVLAIQRRLSGADG